MVRLKYKIENEEVKSIETKLGVVQINLASAICFPHGIVGFGNKHYYCLTEIPENKMPGALLLQSAEENKLSFVVIPLVEKFYAPTGGLLAYDDVMNAASSYDIKPENLNLLVIATLSRIEEEYKVSINLKAPIFLDTIEKVAYQHVFIRSEYPLAYGLN